MPVPNSENHFKKTTISRATLISKLKDMYKTLRETRSMLIYTELLRSRESLWKWDHLWLKQSHPTRNVYTQTCTRFVSATPKVTPSIILLTADMEEGTFKSFTPSLYPAVTAVHFSLPGPWHSHLYENHRSTANWLTRLANPRLTCSIRCWCMQIYLPKLLHPGAIKSRWSSFYFQSLIPKPF